MRLRRAKSYTSAAASQVLSGTYDQRMRTGAIVIGVLLVLGGSVWIAQGLDLPFAPRSFMTADRLWIFIGAATMLVGGVVVGAARRRA
jgi:hypothetical protein